MKMKSIHLAAAAAMGMSAAANAGTITWNNTSGGAWLTAANWNPNTAVPGSGDIAKFDTAPSANVTYNNTVNIGAIWLTTGAGNITIANDNATRAINMYGGQTINSVSNVGIWLDDNLNRTLSIGQGGSNPTNWTLQNSQTWYVGTGNTLNQQTGTSAASFNLNGKTLTMDGAGYTLLTRINNMASQTAGTIIKKGSGRVVTAGGFNGSITQVQLNQGTFELSSNWSTAKVTAAAGFDFTGNATMQLSGAATDLSSKIKIGDGVTATIDTTGSTTIASYATAFQVGTLGTGAFTKTGANTLTLSGTNTYTGGTTVNQGTLVLDGPTGATGTIRGTLDHQQRRDREAEQSRRARLYRGQRIMSRRSTSRAAPLTTRSLAITDTPLISA